MDTANQAGPLQGLRVIEFGNFIAGPLVSRLLGDFGAEVIKVELPSSGDPIRKWGTTVDGDKSVWWAVQSRNKKCITLNLKDEKGQELARELCQTADIVVENFRPGTMEKWNLGYDDLKEINPKLIMVRISGFGQTGPYRDKAGFGSVGEAMGGLRYVNGYPDLPPPRVGISIGDSLASLFGVIGAVLALYNQVKTGDGEGQMIDVALYESVFAVMDNALPEYYKYGHIKERTGSTLPNVAPSNLYKTADEKWVIIAANADNLFKRLAAAMERSEWIEEGHAYSTHIGRGEHQVVLDEEISAWANKRTAEEILEIMDAHGIPSGPIYNMEDISKDKHYHARDMIRPIDDPELGEVHMPGIVPKLSKTPGSIKWSGPTLGENNEEVYQQLLGLSSEEFKRFSEKGII